MKIVAEAGPYELPEDGSDPGHDVDPLHEGTPEQGAPEEPRVGTEPVPREVRLLLPIILCKLVNIALVLAQRSVGYRS